MNKMEDVLAAVKLNDLLNKKKDEAEKKNCVKTVLIIVGIVALAAAVAYAVYRFMTPDYLEDFDDDFDDDFDEDFFDDDDDITVDESVKSEATIVK